MLLEAILAVLALSVFGMAWVLAYRSVVRMEKLKEDRDGTSVAAGNSEADVPGLREEGPKPFASAPAPAGAEPGRRSAL
jgi:hypothetical protein